MRLSELQQNIVDAVEERIVVMAAASSGKTRVLTERVRKIIKDGIAPRDIAVITFTTLAAQELKDRLADDYKDGIFIGTIHGLAYQFLSVYGIKADYLIHKQEFDKFFTLVKQNPYCVRHIPYIFLDEAQDTSPEEYDFIFNMIRPEKFFIVGDVRQSIYSFKHCSPEFLTQIMDDPNTTVYSLNENYRNGENILRFAKSILVKCGLRDDSIAINQGGQVFQEESSYSNIIKWINNYDNYSDWAILCNTNAEIDMILSYLKKNNIPCATFKQGEVDKKMLDDIMKSNTVKVLTRHSSKGLEFQYVIVWCPAFWGGPEAYRVNYVAATRAQKLLVWMTKKKKKK